MVPPAFAETMREEMKSLLPTEGIKTQVKGNRAYSSLPGMTSISDFDGAMITLLDPKNKRYATAESAAYLRTVMDMHHAASRQIPAEAQQRMAQMKTSTSVRKTGRTRTIHGIRATETELTWTMEMPGGPTGPMRSVFSLWIPEEGEAERHPALRELRFFTQRAYEGTNPVAALPKMAGNGSGMLSGMSALMGELRDAAIVLQMRIASWAPGLSALAGNAVDQDAAVRAADAPLLEVILNLEELSTAEVPASVFDLPREYAVVPLSEILGGLLPGMPGP
jgi:hypothetical protein